MNAQLIHADEPRRPDRALTTPADLLTIALDKGADLDRLERLLTMQQTWEADQARKAYVDAMARFKAEPIRILKDQHVRFAKKDGTVTEYDHASIGNVTQMICAALASHGFAHRWNIEQLDGRVVVTCIITHRLGHSEQTMLRALADDSGGKNGIQAIASTVTYLQRYTLLAATGLATSEGDDDGRSGGDTEAQGDSGDPTPPADSPHARLVADLYSKADEGVEALTAAWREMSRHNRDIVGKAFGDIKRRAERADAERRA